MQQKKPQLDRVRLEEILKKFRNKRILVIGDVGIDCYTIGTVERISPEAPVPIVLVQDEQFKLGLAANVADNVRTLGGQAVLAGILGKDRAAADFKTLLKKSRIGTEALITDPSRRTILKERIVSEKQQLLRVDFESYHKMSRVIESKVIEKITKLIPRSDIIILQDYAKGMLTERLSRAVFKLAAIEKKLVAVDPNPKSALELYKGAYVLTPNTKEAEKLSGIEIKNESSLRAAGDKILTVTNAPHVIITLGKDGMALFDAATRKMQVIPTYAREVYDVSGAGDTVITTVALSIASGASLEEASVLGNLAAGVVVGKRGTATVSPDELLSEIAFHSLP